jgi:cell division protein FtsX
MLVVICLGIQKVNNINKEKAEISELESILEDEFGSVQVVLKKQLTDSEIENVRVQLSNISAIKDVEYISQEDALSEMKNSLGNSSIVFYDEDDTGIAPASFTFKIDFNIDTLSENLFDEIDNQFEKVETVLNNINNIKNINSSYEDEDYLKVKEIYIESGLDGIKEYVNSK